MPERPVQACAAETRRGNQADLGLTKGTLDNLVFDQDERGSG